MSLSRLPWHLLFAAAIVAPLSLPHGVVHAALPIDLEVATDSAAPPGSMQEWGRVLSEMDLARLRLRGRGRADEPVINEIGEGAAKRYHVIGILNRRDELVLPGGRFTQRDAARLKKFLEELPERVEEAAVERGPFGLTKLEFEALYADLAIARTEPTKGAALDDVVAALTEGMSTAVEISPEARAAISRAKPLAAELQGLSRGAALAAALRTAGLALAPQSTRDQPPVLHIFPEKRDQESWPVGWKPQGSPRDVAPGMYQFRNIEIEGFTLAQALTALAAPFKTAIIVDERVLAERKIDPAKIQVKLKRGKTYLRRAVDQILSQARLSGELRVDEAGTPFYWVTQFGEGSTRATK